MGLVRYNVWQSAQEESTLVKVVATDMDGTFLSSAKDYDRSRFERILRHMESEGIRFIVASGNQYAQLRSFFPGKDESIVYVSDNGTVIGENGVLRSTTAFPSALIEAIVEFAVEQGLSYRTASVTKDNLTMILSGVKSAYMLEGTSPGFKKLGLKFYYEMEEIPSFGQLPDDTLLKLMLEVDPQNVHEAIDLINERFGDRITAVWGGVGSIDIALPGVSKGSAIKELLDSWGVDAKDLVSFGDANNDLEMLAMAGRGYAMANTTSERVRAAAKYEAPSNDESGVLVVLEKLLEL